MNKQTKQLLRSFWENKLPPRTQTRFINQIEPTPTPKESFIDFITGEYIAGYAGPEGEFVEEFDNWLYSLSTKELGKLARKFLNK